MKKIAYLECPTGIAGDMCLGALTSAGVPLDYLIEKLKLLGISEEYQLRAELVRRNGQQATKVHVDLLKIAIAGETEDAAISENSEPGEPTEAPTFAESHHHEHPRSQESEPHDHHSRDHSHTRHLPEIEKLIASAGLPHRAEAWSLAVFRKLAEAEGAVHGIAPDKVHFHEVGATDAIVDIVGTCLGLDWLLIDELYCSAMPAGGGTVKAAHGRMPVPTPAVLKLWEMGQVPVYSNGIDRELCTPTGVAIATTLAVGFGKPPAMTVQRVGLGAGNRLLPIPNILRLWVGEAAREEESSAPHSRETICVLETQIDDLNPQAIAYTFDALFAAGALDVFTQAIGMKKSRTGILLTVICHPDKQHLCEEVIFRETTTLGIRRTTQQRTILQRELHSVTTPLGEVRVKVAKYGESGAIANVQPEYEDVAQLARQHEKSWREVHRMALQSWYSQHNLDG